MLNNLINELCNILFIGSVIYLLHILGNFFIKAYSRFKLNIETKFVLTKQEKILLWITLTIFFSYIF